MNNKQNSIGNDKINNAVQPVLLNENEVSVKDEALSVIDEKVTKKAPPVRKLFSILFAFVLVFFVIGYSVYTVLTVETAEEITIFLNYSDSEDYKQDIKKGTTFLVPNAPSRLGYEFGGWFANKERTVPFDFDKPIKQNTTIYVKWNIKQFRIVFSTNNVSDISLNNNFASSVFSQDRQVEFNSTVFIDNNSSGLGNLSKRFVCWNTKPDYSGDNYYLGDRFNMPAKNMTLFAKWENIN